MTASVMLAALALDTAIGWPDPVYRRIGHPVTWMGRAIGLADEVLNRPSRSHAARYGLGAATTITLVGGVFTFGFGVSSLLPTGWKGVVIEALLAAPLLAGRSLHAHVAAVATPLLQSDLAGARLAVGRIVGRDPEMLDRSGVARAAIESLAENASDGVIAPLFWGVLLGLPGIAAYKVINTLDSMIGHRTERHLAFGGFAARLDDVANILPARVTGLLFAAAALSFDALRAMWRDAGHHRSPNAGWPEAAVAGTLGIRLSGPRSYEGRLSGESWLNADGDDPSGVDVTRALHLYVRMLLVATGLLAAAALA